MNDVGLTFSISTYDEAGVIGAESVSQHLLLEVDDWLEHSLVLDLSGRDDNAAVHEVSDGIGQVLVSLSQVRLQTKHLHNQTSEQNNK